MSHHDHHADDYVRGEMDISEHKSTYNLFAGLTKWGSLTFSVILVFLVVMTCISHGNLFSAFLNSGIAAVVVAVAGWFILREKPAEH